MTKGYRQYSKTKESQVRWLGEIPDHWATVQSRRLFDQRKERMRPGDEQLTASQKYGVIPQSAFMRLEDQKVMQVFTGADILKHVEPNDFVISMRSFQGGLEWCSYSGCVSSAYVGITPRKHVVAKFFKYLFKSAPYIQALQSTSNLVRDGQALRFHNFAQVPLPLVPESEQSQIANFLDHEASKIDALIDKQQQLIALLREKRQAVISHAVTRGLNPDVPVRDSGVEWLGEIPTHWRVSAPKHFTSKIIDGPHHTPNYVDEGIPFVTVKNLTEGEWISLDDTKRISPADHREFIKRAHPQPGDILITKDGTLGVTRVIETAEEFSIFVSVALVKLKAHEADPWFIRFAFESSTAWAQFSVMSAGAALKHIVLSTIANVKIPLPPVEEQKEIGTALRDQCNRIDDLVASSERRIQLLQERRTALISAAVTGKIDVRNWRAPETQREAAHA